MATAVVARKDSTRVAVQKLGTFLSGMILPTIPALIAWGIFMMFFIEKGFTPNADLSSIVGPFIHYLLPILIAYTGGQIVYAVRGAVVASIATFGAIAGSDLLIAQFNATQPADNQLGQIHMFIGAMILAPVSAYGLKWLDGLWEDRIRTGLEMLVKMFSAGVWGFVMAVAGFYPIAWLVNGIMTVLSGAVDWLIANNLLPLSVALSATVTLVIAAVILRASRRRDLAAISQTEANKGSSSGALAGLRGDHDATATGRPVKTIVFACDAGMGSSAMGASVLRRKIQAAGFGDVAVVNKAIANLDDRYDVVVSHQDLIDRASRKTPSAVHVAVENFMASPRYDEVVEMVRAANSEPGAAEPAGVAAERAAAPVTVRTTPARAIVTEPPAAEGSAEAEAGDSGVLTLSSIVLSGAANDQVSAIDEAGRLLVEAGAVEAGYVGSMHARERSVSTYMGNFLAIPHGTNDAKAMIRSSAISVVRYPAGIDWNGNPVKFVIGIAGANDEHLELLSKIAEVFLDAEAVAALEKAGTREEIADTFKGVNS